MKDFNNNVLNYDKPGMWKLDDGLAGPLLKINKNKFIQTLYSKKANFLYSEYRHESYIQICYAAKIELKIFREIIPDLLFKFCKNNVTFYYSFDCPTENFNINDDESQLLGLGCTDDKKYFNVNTLRLSIETDHREIHEDFWQTIEYSFSKLKL